MSVIIDFAVCLFILKNFCSCIFSSPSPDLIPHSCREHSDAYVFFFFFFIYFCQLKIISFVSGWLDSIFFGESLWDVVYILGAQKLYQYVPSLSFLIRISPTRKGDCYKPRHLQTDISTYYLFKSGISILGLSFPLSIIVSTFVLCISISFSLWLVLLVIKLTLDDTIYGFPL